MKNFNFNFAGTQEAPSGLRTGVCVCMCDYIHTRSCVLNFELREGVHG
jgi:hypothetical protein